MTARLLNIRHYDEAITFMKCLELEKRRYMEAIQEILEYQEKIKKRWSVPIPETDEDIYL